MELDSQLPQRESLLSSAELYCDGAAKGNPGPGSYGFVLTKDGSVIYEEGRYLGRVTNNEAEYQGLIAGLEAALDRCVRVLTVKADSELMVKQLRGEYRVKAPNLLPLFLKAKSLLNKFARVNLNHIPRAQNYEADRLANQALKEHWLE